ncbi:MAG: Rpn family recombination-promoting nuclease/putative transposase [Lachnospiraceae bacterium]|nr:Rpn family recombination-promoting nuclease/putative transposase [Lachnospiraceae bacterium]
MSKYNEKTLNRAKSLRLIDDAFFRLVGARKKVCQEILRTLLTDDNLVVKEVTVQKTEVSIYRELVLDALCTLGDGSLCNIEVQKSDANNDIKRARFHASLITSNHTPKKTSFDNIPNVKIIYITEYDVLGNGQAVTHISRCQLVRNTYKPVNDGEDIFFANAASKQRNKQSHLLKLFLKSDSFYDEAYPALSRTVKHFKDSKKGRDQMCQSIEEYAAESSIDAIIKTCLAHKDSLEQTIQFVKYQFSEATNELITDRYHLLSGVTQ